jgi:hypothetical protein
MPRIDRSVSKRSTIIQLAAVALSGIVPVCSATKPAAHHALNPARFAGAFCELGTARPRDYVARLGEMAEPGAIVAGGRRLLCSIDMAGFFHVGLGAGYLQKAQPARNVVWSAPP